MTDSDVVELLEKIKALALSARGMLDGSVIAQRAWVLGVIAGMALRAIKRPEEVEMPGIAEALVMRENNQGTKH